MNHKVWFDAVRMMARVMNTTVGNKDHAKFFKTLDEAAAWMNGAKK